MQKEKRFEALLSRTEEISQMLEQNDLPLEEALALYKEGALTIQAMQKKLEKAKQEVIKVTVEIEGTYKETAVDIMAMDNE